MAQNSDAPNAGTIVVGATVGGITVVFIVLKLCGVIAWTWLWILSPLWIFGGLAVLTVLAGAGIAVAVAVVQDAHDRPRRGEPLHGPVRKWGYRKADVDRLNTHADQAEAAPEELAIKVAPNLPGLVAWCEEHGQPRYDGPTPCDPKHQASGDEGYCAYHERSHGPMEWGDLCQAWDEVDSAELEQSRRRRYLRWLHP